MRHPSTPDANFEVHGRPRGGLGEPGPSGSPNTATKARLDVVTTLHQLIDTLTELSNTVPTTPSVAPARDLPLLLDAVEAGKLLTVSRAKVLDLAARGEIPSLRVGGSVRIPRDPLMTWIADNTNPVKTSSPMRLPEWVHVDRSLER